MFKRVPLYKKSPSGFYNPKSVSLIFVILKGNGQGLKKKQKNKFKLQFFSINFFLI